MEYPDWGISNQAIKALLKYNPLVSHEIECFLPMLRRDSGVLSFDDVVYMLSEPHIKRQLEEVTYRVVLDQEYVANIECHDSKLDVDDLVLANGSRLGDKGWGTARPLLVKELPDWMQKHLAVLSMTSDDPPTKHVDGVGRRIARNVFWIVSPTEEDENGYDPRSEG
tara:strand:- start:555 stop:1055 length:501 start_codon:yes stop_codon:yes gene_type:complete